MYASKVVRHESEFAFGRSFRVKYSNPNPNPRGKHSFCTVLLVPGYIQHHLVTKSAIYATTEIRELFKCP